MKQKLPSAKDMKTFAKKYDKQQWAKICAEKDFLDLFGYDVSNAGVMAEMILSDKYSREKFNEFLKKKAEAQKQPEAAKK